MPVPVHIVSGFLGTGKTSAIRAQLEARAGERIAVIVNDFGRASFDAAALESSAPFRLVSIPGGCVCCTAPEGFVAALGAVLEQEPQRLLIEPTGLARPQDLVDTIRRCPHRDALALGPVVVLVDPRRLGRDAGAEERLVLDQVQVADVLVANHSDRCSAEELARFDRFAAELWPPPLAVQRTRFGRIAPELFEWPEQQGARLPRAARASRGAHPHPHARRDSSEGFAVRSFRFSPELVFSRERLAALLARLAAGEAGVPLARFKGIFRTREGTRELEVAGGSVSERPSAHRRDSCADCILAAEREADAEDAFGRVERWLEEAVLSEEELRARAHEIELVREDEGSALVVDRSLLAALPDPVDDVSALFPKRAGSAARVRALLERLAVPEAGVAVVCAADGFASEPVDVPALCEGVLVHSLAGEPLPESKGGPFRLLIPEGVPGAPSACSNVKAVTRIVLRGAADPGAPLGRPTGGRPPG